MCKIAFSIPNEVLYDTRQSEEEALQFVKRFTALSYYVHRGVSLGHASQIADMDKESFIKFLGENGVSIFRFDDEKEFLEEVANA
jgi:predicted HTH domain antitoxin